MYLKTILNRVQKHPSLVYESAELVEGATGLRLVVYLRERQGTKPICSGCGKKRSGYERQSKRRWLFVPLWNIPVYFVYAPRRCDCPRCGVKVETTLTSCSCEAGRDDGRRTSS